MAARPGFTAVAILSLALGIGANTAIFSLWNGVLHAPLPASSNPEQLVMLTDPGEAGMWRGTLGRPDRRSASLAHLRRVRAAARSRRAASRRMMATQSSISTWQVRVDGDGAPVGRSARPPGLGRLLRGAGRRRRDRPRLHDRRGSRRHRRRRHQLQLLAATLRRPPDVLGKTLTVRNAAVTIIGVAPPGFVGETSGQQPDLWLPLRLQPSVLPGSDWLHDTPPEKAMWLHVFGRLKPGVTLAQAEAQANAIFQAGLESFYGAAASGERRREFLDQRLQVRPAARGASSMRDRVLRFADRAAGGGRRAAADCVRESGQPPARARRRAPSRDDRVRLSLGAEPRTADPPTGHGESGAGRAGRRGRNRRRLRASQRARPDAGRIRPAAST